MPRYEVRFDYTYEPLGGFQQFVTMTRTEANAVRTGLQTAGEAGSIQNVYVGRVDLPTIGHDELIELLDGIPGLEVEVRLTT